MMQGGVCRVNLWKGAKGVTPVNLMRRLFTVELNF